MPREFSRGTRPRPLMAAPVDQEVIMPRDFSSGATNLYAQNM